MIGRRTSLAAQIDTADDFLNEYQYDALSRLMQLTQQEESGGHSVAEKRVDFGYNLAKQFASLARYADLAGSNLVATSAYGYDNAGRLNALTHAQSSTTFADYGWTWDDANRITSFTNTEHSGEDATYTYDDAGQLTGGNYSTQTDESYSYDDNGNRTNSGYSTGDNNQLTSDGTYTYEYDAEGNLVQRLNTTDGSYTLFEWDHRNRLVAVTDFNEDDEQLLRAEYTYDAFNRRIAKHLDNDGDGDVDRDEFYVYDDAGRDIVLDFVDSDGEGETESPELARRYLWGPMEDQLLAQETYDAGTDSVEELLWALTDHLGTARDFVEYNTGTTSVVEHFVIDSFGNVLDGDTSVSRYLFTAQEYDAETGNYYYDARYYGPSIGRFFSPDPVRTPPQNLYAYVSNSPTNYTDPTGLVPPGTSQKPKQEPEPEPEPRPSYPPPEQILCEMQFGGIMTQVAPRTPPKKDCSRSECKTTCSDILAGCVAGCTIACIGTGPAYAACWAKCSAACTVAWAACHLSCNLCALP